ITQMLSVYIHSPVDPTTVQIIGISVVTIKRSRVFFYILIMAYFFPIIHMIADKGMRRKPNLELWNR
ncbi:unnamed protein product, partial [Nesidiocoris tenuis]